MKKKGFTLVELLAVIAILAILVIIALPNVMGMFNTAKKNSFSTEVKEVIRQAKTQYVTDSGLNFGTTNEQYCYQNKGTNDAEITGAKKLDMSGRSISYAICFNKANQVVTLAATDQTYVVSCHGGSPYEEASVKVADAKFEDGNCTVATITDTEGKTGAKITYDSTNKIIKAELTN